MDALLDLDYFSKAIDECLKNRFGFSENEILKNEERVLKDKEEKKKQLNDMIKDLGNYDKITYLEKMVYPALYPGLMMLEKERPEDPLTALAIFLLQNKNLCDTPANLIYTGKENDDPEEVHPNETQKPEDDNTKDEKEELVKEENEIKEIKENKDT